MGTLKLFFDIEDGRVCPVCGMPHRNGRRNCPRERAFICSEHCRDCAYHNAESSLNICTYEQAFYADYASADHGQGFELLGVRLWQDKSTKLYIVASGKARECDYEVFPADEPWCAVSSLVRRADAVARGRIGAAARRGGVPELTVDKMAERGVKLWAMSDGVFAVDYADGDRAMGDALEMWVRFRDSIEHRLIEAAQKVIRARV